MKVFFTGSFYGKQQYQLYYDHILSILENNNISVLSLERKNYLNKFLSKHNINDHYRIILNMIKLCDACIIETSVDSFRLGHEATLALSYYKPVLLLSTSKDYSLYISHKLIKAKYYQSITDLTKYINEFISTINSDSYSERINIKINKEQKKFLDSIKADTNNSYSEYIRKLINKEINKTYKF